MGYVSAAEMDAGNSELRYMDSSNCFADYNGAITSLSSADIIDEAGLRLSDPAVPGPQSGFYYLVKPECDLGSWQTGIGAEPERDAQLP